MLPGVFTDPKGKRKGVWKGNGCEGTGCGRISETQRGLSTDFDHRKQTSEYFIFFLLKTYKKSSLQATYQKEDSLQKISKHDSIRLYNLN